jgi:hypothetical protein
MFGGEHNDAAGSGLIAEHLSRSKKNESENQTHHHVILPAGARIVPEQETLHAADWASHILYQFSMSVSRF